MLRVILTIVRICFGLFFVAVSVDKLLVPYQNFLYIVQSYEIFPPVLEEAAARCVPWVEFFLGIFLCLGLWTRRVLQVFIILLLSFILIIAQAIFRQLPIEDCGCFGSLLSVPLQVTLGLDFLLLATAKILLKKEKETISFSLDNYFKSDSLSQ